MSDREIRAEIQRGAIDAEALAARCAAGTRCGGCREVVDALLRETAVAMPGVVAA